MSRILSCFVIGLLFLPLTSCAMVKTLSLPEKKAIASRTATSQDKVVQQVYSIKQAIEAQYNVKIWFNKKCRTYWGRYRIAQDNNELLQYMKMMQSEIKKYPTDFFVKSRAQNICFGEHLDVAGVVVAAMPAPEDNTLLFSLARDVKSKGRKPYRIGYQTNTFHHELFHNTDFVIWGRHYYKWREWSKLNIPGFRYAGKGTMAYTQKGKMRKMKRQKGFMNKYSQTGMEEDRAEIMEAIMLYPERKLIVRRCQKDNIIKQKVSLLVDIIDKRVTKQHKWHIHDVVKACNQPRQRALYN